ncbi:polyprenyl synthetase family protein [Streptosporangium carneum]|uniref:Geranylgeranyl pyrophosphate synthase n=1 Tax=Streptosporangium carneum TaxID=47481 RepID=A0A9W6HZ51_9ACTN|nr:polyprenyl synthetase family protein [Streptosporangium carneum]GLK08971.1 geranylgeranyl pyrophosphate synthase [Streptosporangium carneum]
MVTVTREADRLRERMSRYLDDFLEREASGLAFLGDDLDVLRRILLGFVREGGKRLRPSFVHWGHRAAGGSPDDEAVLAAGCAVELVHACALILDDVMDESDTRRGRPTVHLALAEHHGGQGWRGDPGRFGESTATLFGMLAYTWADAALLRAGPRLAEALEVLTLLRAEVVGGQYLDLAHAARGSADLAEAARISTYKSGKYTVERPLHLGHAVAGGDPRQRAVLSAYALPLGEAFQLRDDVLGVFGDPSTTGKPVGADLRQGKHTWLTALARERADGYGAALLDHVSDEADVAEARELIIRTGALDTVERRIADLVSRATEALEGGGVPAEAVRGLSELADAATRRNA